MDMSNIESYTHYWNPLIMRVLVNSTHNPDSILFGITGDIDNLGIYVAKNGRAKAENLVDLFNQIIRNEFIRWAHTNKDCLDDMAFVASGEEIVMLGFCRDQSIVESLFHEINTNINKLLRDNHYIDIGETGISFGCAMFNEEKLVEKIRQMSNVMRKMSGEDEYVLYLEIMECIRETLARELDKIKFKNLTDRTVGSHIMYRNLVYAHMLNYKYETARFLITLSENVASTRINERYGPLCQRYGLDDNNRRLALEVKEIIENIKGGNS